MSAYMRYNQVARDDDQIVHADPSPVLLTPVASPRHICTNFARPLKEEPDMVAFLHPYHASRETLAMVEGEREHELGRFDGFLDLQVLLPQLVFQLALFLHHRFGHSLGSVTNGGIGFQSLLHRRD